MSPRSTLKNCGSSSRLVRRRNAPTRRHARIVARCLAQHAGLLGMHAHRAELVDREHAAVGAFASCVKKTGPREVSLIAIAMANRSGASRDQDRRGEDTVKGILLQQCARRKRRRDEVDRRRRRADRSCRCSKSGETAHVGNEADIHEIVAKLVNELQDHALLRKRQRKPKLRARLCVRTCCAKGAKSSKTGRPGDMAGPAHRRARIENRLGTKPAGRRAARSGARSLSNACRSPQARPLCRFRPALRAERAPHT